MTVDWWFSVNGATWPKYCGSIIKVCRPFCETQWPRPPLFSPSWLIQSIIVLSMGEGSYITLFSPSDVTAFHRMKCGGRGCYITLFLPSDVPAFHRIGHIKPSPHKCEKASVCWVNVGTVSKIVCWRGGGGVDNVAARSRYVSHTNK